MSSVYRRYFKITEGSLIGEVNRIRAVDKKASEEYKVILEDIGAKATYYQRNSKLVAVTFSGKVDTGIYKKVSPGWYPKQNNKTGKEIHQRFKKVVTEDVDNALEMIGITGSLFLIMDGRQAYSATITTIPSDPIACLITVPWKDIDPEELKQYKLDRDEGVRGDMSMDHLCWEPTPEMNEIKSWEAEKIIDEWNESVTGE